jgi:hypothetical protein
MAAKGRGHGTDIAVGLPKAGVATATHAYQDTHVETRGLDLPVTDITQNREIGKDVGMKVRSLAPYALFHGRQGVHACASQRALPALAWLLRPITPIARAAFVLRACALVRPATLIARAGGGRERACHAHGEAVGPGARDRHGEVHGAEARHRHARGARDRARRRDAVRAVRSSAACLPACVLFCRRGALLLRSVASRSRACQTWSACPLPTSASPRVPLREHSVRHAGRRRSSARRSSSTKRLCSSRRRS